MSKLTRALIVGAPLAAMHLLGMTAVAQAHATDGVAVLAARRASRTRRAGQLA
jgi:hypothetical protein